MKNILVVFLLAFFTFSSANAQFKLKNNTPEANNTETEKKEEVQTTKKSFKGRDRFMINLTFDNLFHKETNGFKTQWHSRGIGLYYLQDFPLGTERVSFAAGVGFRHASYYHNSNMVEDSVQTTFTPIPNFKDDDNFKQRKVAVNYFEVPLELRFFTKPSLKTGNMFKVAVGFRGGVRMTGVRVEKNKDNGYYKKFKTKNFKDLALWEAGPTLRVGYGGFNIFAYYSVTELFKKNSGPKMTPFSIGISFIGL
ncbi:MAG: outer membrane beta-barrel protein [Bacteroidetes bacterium]|nr:outer membrane beta-barrel protein [Bacteroidota bacterium]MCB9227574.1 outer membrane beta-barrel protein [Chitinophagales bacterium]